MQELLEYTPKSGYESRPPTLGILKMQPFMAGGDVLFKQYAFRNQHSQRSPVATLPLYDLLLYAHGENVLSGNKEPRVWPSVIVISQAIWGRSTLFCYKVILHM